MMAHKHSSPGERVMTEATRHAFLLHAVREWLPPNVHKDVKRVHVEKDMAKMTHLLKVEFQNGRRSPALPFELTGRSLVTPMKVTACESEFTYWQATCCMIAGPEVKDGRA